MWNVSAASRCCDDILTASSIDFHTSWSVLALSNIALATALVLAWNIIRQDNYRQWDEKDMYVIVAYFSVLLSDNHSFSVLTVASIWSEIQQHKEWDLWHKDLRPDKCIVSTYLPNWKTKIRFTLSVFYVLKCYPCILLGRLRKKYNRDSRISGWDSKIITSECEI
jgi:hypothetical protein